MRTTRYIGYCPPCNGYYKVRDNVLVHHGYQRPGIGYIVGDCLGVHKSPHELSPERALAYHEICEQHYRRALALLAHPPSKLSYEDYNSPEGREHYRKHKTPLLIQIDASHREWDRTLRRFIQRMEAERDSAQREMQRMAELLQDWRPRPLKTVEEEQAEVRDVRERKQAEARATKDQKNAELIAKMQARIDSSVRTQNMGSLASIYESVIHNLGPKLSSAVERVTTNEALRLVDRNHVWQAFDLPVVKPSRDDQAQWDQIGAKLAAMQGYGFRGRRETVEWPPELGEPKRKRAR